MGKLQNGKSRVIFAAGKTSKGFRPNADSPVNLFSTAKFCRSQFQSGYNFDLCSNRRLKRCDRGIGSIRRC
jgi:hypothetical protein